MKNLRTFLSPALLAGTVLAGLPARADNMASIAIAPATGVVTLVPRWAIGGGLAGFHQMAQNTGFSVGANNFYSIKGGAIPAGGDIAAFTYYLPASGAATNHADVGSKLTPNSYSALTSADPDVGFGAVNFYFIHHKGTTDYFSVIVPGSGVASAVTDLKPMSGPGGPATVTGVSGYFGLTFAASNLGYGLNNFYYLRRDPVTLTTKFGTLEPALLGTSADKFDLGMGGHSALAFTGTDVGYGTDKMYFLRLDPITGFSILGTLHPVTGRAADIANLGSVYSTLTFVAGDLGFGVGRFYTTGVVNPTWQSVSFAAISDRLISAGSFTVTPSASSALPIVLTVVPGSTGAASISGPVGGVFTVTPTAPGLITLQATQAGQAGLFEPNMLRQSFMATGAATLLITAQPANQSAVAGSTVNFSVAASGTSALSYQWRKAGINLGAGNASATTPTLTLMNAQAADAGTYDVVVTNASGSIPSQAVTLTLSTATPVITSPLVVAATAGTPFSYATAANGSPTSFSASPLPLNGLSIAPATGVITGTPTAPGTMAILLGATNASGTGNATLTITIAAAGVAPIINSSLAAAGTVGTPFSYTTTATGSPTSYTASTLPLNGLSIGAATGVITGTPATVGTMVVPLGATNASGTGNATLTITIAPAGVAPIITNIPLSAVGTVGMPFGFVITASGTPTSYSATGLPSGLTLNPLTGAIGGVPMTAGTFVVPISATNSLGTSTSTLTITVAAASVAPVITSPIIAPATVGASFITYQIAATGFPTLYTATNLPPGLTLNPQTGAINGTPTEPGTSIVVLTATNAAGAGTSTVTIVVAPAAVAPIITSPTTAGGAIGTPFVTYVIAATGLPTSYSATGLPPGLTLNPLTGAINGTPTTAGTFPVTLIATNATGTSTSTVSMVIAPAAVAPIITSLPTAVGTMGAPFVTYLIGATGLPTSYSATGLPPGLTLNPLTGAINGTPTTSGTFPVTLTATNVNGTSTSTLTMVIASNASSRIVNFSARALSGPGDQTLIMGFVVSGNGKNLLVRGIGPGLAPFGVINALADPMLTLYGSGGAIATNDDWHATVSGQPDGAAIAATARRVGAFALSSGSKDSALLATFNHGAHTTSMVRPNSTTGVALTEIYDTDVAAGSRLVNVSARMNVTAGEGMLVAGLVIAGDAPKTVLIRGIGPALSAFAVTGAMVDPTVSVYTGSTQVASNDNWGSGTSTAAQIGTAAARVGAFPLPADSRDAALLITLQPGAYTVQVTGVGNSTGVALIEVYDTH